MIFVYDSIRMVQEENNSKEGEFQPPPVFPPPEGGNLTDQGKEFIVREEEKPSVIKKILPLIFVLGLLVIVAGGVFKFLLPALIKPKEITLTYWGLWEPDQVLSQVIAAYQKDHPHIKINYVFQSPRDYRERLASAFAQGKGPDIFRFHATWVPMFKNDLSPLPAKVMDAATFEATFYPVARQDLRLGTSYVGIPLEIDTLGLFVNEEIFEAASKTPPTTWDELRKTAIDLTVTSNGKIQVAGVALGRTENVDHWPDILALMMLQNGADLSRPQGNLAEDALTFFTLFPKVDGVWDQTLPPSTIAFANGKLAMYFGPSWEVFEIKKINPKLRFRVLPVPQLEGTNIAWASYWAEGVSKKSAHQEEAWEFLKYLSQKETLQKLYQSASQIRAFGEPYARTDMANLLLGDDLVGAFIKQAPIARSWYLCSRTFDNGLNDKMIKYFGDAVNAVNAGKSAKEALETTAAGVAQVFSQYGIAAPVVR